MIKSENKNFNGKTFADLCCGIGGFRLALEEEGAKCVFSSEIDKFACYVYENNFNEIPSGDISKINTQDIPDFDILCAGFPCQPFSVSGKQEGFKDITRGTIFFDILRIIEAKKPEIVLLENVANITKHDNGLTFDIIMKSIESLNYTVHHACLNALDFGAPQNRNRMYIVALRNDITFKSFCFPEPIVSEKCIADILEPEEDINPDLFKSAHDMVMKADIKSKEKGPVQIAHVGSNRQGERIYSINGGSICFTANGGGRFSKTGGYLVNGKPRKLSSRECARLMGFPEDFILDKSYNQAIKQLGNAVVVDVVQYIINGIIYEK